MVLGLSVGLLFLASSTGDGWLVLLSGLGIGLVATALLLHPRLAPLDVVVTLPPRTRVGEEVELRVDVTNRGRRTSVPLTASVGTPSFGFVSVHVPALDPGQSAVSTNAMTAQRRGDVHDVAVVLHTTAPFSMISATSRRTRSVATLVRPALGTALTTESRGTGDLDAPPGRGPGVEVRGVRVWHRGEPTGRLYARGTARHGRPLVLDRHDDVGRPGLAVVVGAIDEVGSGAAAHPSLLHELMIEIVAATLAARAADGLDVTAIARQRGLADVTSTDVGTLLDWCARLGSSGAPTLADIDRAAAAVGPGGQVVLAQLAAPTDPTVIEALVRAADGHGARLQLLHRMEGRTDALCLHDARVGTVAAHASGRSS